MQSCALFYVAHNLDTINIFNFFWQVKSKIFDLVCLFDLLPSSSIALYIS